MSVPHYPVNDFGPLMKGLVIGGGGIVHVFLAQFAIGGGMLLWYFERLAQRGDQEAAMARTFVDGFFPGARARELRARRAVRRRELVHHWLWATEWVCFAVEVVAGYAFYKVGHRLDSKTRLRLLALYAIASWLSLFFINGIISWQLTPGSEPASVWHGFFNASFWPSLLYRTCVSMALAALAACVVINTMDLDHEARASLIQRASRFAGRSWSCRCSPVGTSTSSLRTAGRGCSADRRR